jgi:alpha,alpha-trehalose phosphorylase
MAARNLRAAAEAAGRYRERAEDLAVDEEEVRAWRAAADAMVVPFDAELRVTAQSEGFTRYRRWDFAATPPEAYPLLMSCPYYLLYSSQVVKQADLVLALYSCGDSFDLEQKRRDFAYYEPITVRDSTLSASIQAIVGAEVGHLGLAYEYFRETALVDLRDLAGNTADGLHLASLAGAWLVAVAGFGGMRDHGDLLTFAPTLPPALRRVCFRLLYRGRCVKVEIVPGEARYELDEGGPIEVVHHGERVALAAGAPQVLPWEPPPPAPAVGPPPGREPTASGVGAD